MSSTETRTRTLSAAARDNAAAALLCTAAGFADAIGFVNLGVFAANMTGNTVLAALSLAALDWAATLDRSMTLVTFFGGAIAGRVLLRLGRDQPWLALLVESLMIGAAAFIDPGHPASIWLIACAMGVQATAMTKFRGAAVSTVVITSTMARIAEAVTDLVLAPLGIRRGAPGAPTSLLGLTWVFYGVGALVAALLMPLTDLPLLVPAVIVLAVIGLTRIRTSDA